MSRLPRGPGVLMVVANTFATDTRVRREARALASEGYSVEVLCWDRQGRRPFIEMLDGCRVYNARFGKGTVLVISRLYFMIAAVAFQALVLFWSVRLLARTYTLFLHAHDFNTLVGCAAVKQLFKSRVRLVYDCHELTPGVYEEWYGHLVSGIAGRLEAVALRWIDAMIAANEAILHYLQEKRHVPAEVVCSCPAVEEVPHVSQLDARKRLGLCGFITLFSGRVRQDYDLEMLLEAAHDLRRNGVSDFRFVFTGPPEAMQSFLSTTVKDELQGLLDFRGWVPSKDLLLYYIASDLCYAVTNDIGPNTTILTPIKLFESMACGLPVVVRAETLAAEITRTWGCGIAIRNRGTRFSAELARLKGNQQLLHDLGKAGRRAFLTEYNWDRMQGRLLHLYAGLWAHR